MRPLCGAIITAGALIGLGLFSQGYGTRYAAYVGRNEKGEYDTKYWVTLAQMDAPLMILLVMLVATLIIGLAIAFVGLAYHHHKRHLEFLHRKGHAQASGLITKP